MLAVQFDGAFGIAHISPRNSRAIPQAQCRTPRIRLWFQNECPLLAAFGRRTSIGNPESQPSNRFAWRYKLLKIGGNQNAMAETVPIASVSTNAFDQEGSATHVRRGGPWSRRTLLCTT